MQCTVRSYLMVVNQPIIWLSESLFSLTHSFAQFSFEYFLFPPPLVYQAVKWSYNGGIRRNGNLVMWWTTGLLTITTVTTSVASRQATLKYSYRRKKPFFTGCLLSVIADDEGLSKERLKRSVGFTDKSTLKPKVGVVLLYCKANSSSSRVWRLGGCRCDDIVCMTRWAVAEGNVLIVL